jgi:hypothetical protein
VAAAAEPGTLAGPRTTSARRVRFAPTPNAAAVAAAAGTLRRSNRQSRRAPAPPADAGRGWSLASLRQGSSSRHSNMQMRVMRHPRKRMVAHQN